MSINLDTLSDNQKAGYDLCGQTQYDLCGGRCDSIRENIRILIGICYMGDAEERTRQILNRRARHWRQCDAMW